MIVWDAQAVRDFGEKIATDGAARIAAAANRIAGTRFTVTAEGTNVVTRDRAALVAEYGDGRSPADPWVHRAIREADRGGHE